MTMSLDPSLLIGFTIMGLLGGLAYILFEARKWKNLRSFDSIRRLALGAIMGLVYYFMHSDWNYPNAVSSFIYGLAATFIIESTIERYKKGK